mgnify:CR=1 FL=1
MKIELLKLLRCPKTGQRFEVENGSGLLQDDENTSLITTDAKESYTVLGGIPRFVPRSNYADNFGMQWNHFRKTQLESEYEI